LYRVELRERRVICG